MKYKGILLDLDDTLYNYSYAHTNALKAAITAEDQAAFAEARKQTGINLKKTASSHNRLLYFQKMLELQGKSPFKAFAIYEKYWGTFLENMRFYPGAIDFLEKVKHLPIALITDLTAHIQYRKIKKLGLEKYINALVTSEEIGIEKPAPQMFKAGLHKLNLNPQEVCMIGDNYEKDILGAGQLGIESYWLNWKKQNHSSSQSIISVYSFQELTNSI